MFDQVKTKYVMVLDAGDVAIQHTENMIENFEHYGKPVLFGATKSRFPNYSIDKVKDRDFWGDYCYLNAGTCFGLAGKVHEFYKLCKLRLDDVIADLNREFKEIKLDEQLIVRWVFHQSQDWVAIDYLGLWNHCIGWDALLSWWEEKKAIRIRNMSLEENLSGLEAGA